MTKAKEIVEIPATITARGQTTVPAAVRRMLRLDKSGRVVFRALADGTVIIAKADIQNEDDPALEPFLTLLEHDLVEHPGAVEPVSQDVYRRALALVEGVDIDLDGNLPDDDA